MRYNRAVALGVGPSAAGSGSEEANISGLKFDKNGNYEIFDFEAQCRSVFENVKLILEESGSSWENLVDVTIFLVDMKRDFKTDNEVYAAYFKDDQPCRTMVEINALPYPIAIELKCIATIPKSNSFPNFDLFLFLTFSLKFLAIAVCFQILPQLNKK